MNRGFLTAAAGVGAAQLLKLPISRLQTGRWDLSQVFGTGGMPSSHSSGVAALTTYTAMKKGVNSIEFAMSAFYGLVVMYDAMGIRRHAGEIAVEVNELDQRVEQLADEHPGIFHEKRTKMLQEKLGHMPIEVVGGAVVGSVVGAASFFMELTQKSKKNNRWLKFFTD